MDMADVKFDINMKLDCWYRHGCPDIIGDCECKSICQAYLEMNQLISSCGMSKAEKYIINLIPSTVHEKKMFQRLDEIRKGNMIEWVNGGNNLFITSVERQTGKTSWAMKLMYRYFHEMWPGNGFIRRGYYINVPEFVNKYKSIEARQESDFIKVSKILKDVELVIWDDIGKFPLTVADQNLLSLFIDNRVREDKANIFTSICLTNSKLVELKNQDGTKALDANGNVRTFTKPTVDESALIEQVGSNLAFTLLDSENIILDGPCFRNRQNGGVNA